MTGRLRSAGCAAPSAGHGRRWAAGGGGAGGPSPGCAAAVAAWPEAAIHAGACQCAAAAATAAAAVACARGDPGGRAPCSTSLPDTYVVWLSTDQAASEHVSGIEMRPCGGCHHPTCDLLANSYLQPAERSDSARDASRPADLVRPVAAADSLAAARAAVLPDLAANPPPASPPGGSPQGPLECEGDGGLGRALSAPPSHAWPEVRRCAAGSRTQGRQPWQLTPPHCAQSGCCISTVWTSLWFPEKNLKRTSFEIAIDLLKPRPRAPLAVLALAVAQILKPLRVAGDGGAAAAGQPHGQPDRGPPRGAVRPGGAPRPRRRAVPHSQRSHRVRTAAHATA